MSLMSTTSQVTKNMQDQLTSCSITTNGSAMQRTAALVNALNIEARVYLKLNNPVLARQACSELFKYDPKNICALNTYNSACCDLYTFKDATASLQIVAESFDSLSMSEQVMHLNNCAHIAYFKYDFFSARSALLNSIHLQSHNPQARLLLQYIKQDYNFDWALENDANNMQYKKALFYLASNHVDQAYEIGKKLFDADHKDVQAQYIQIFCNLAQSPADLKSAFEMANHLLAEDHLDTTALMLRAYCGYFLDFEKSKLDIAIILERDPQSQLFQKMYTLIEDFEKKGRVPTLAERISALDSSCIYTSQAQKATEAIALSLGHMGTIQSSPETLFNYAWCLIEQGNCQAALLQANKLRQLSRI